MRPTDIAGAIARLDTTSSPAAVRFDDGPPLQARVATLPSAYNPPTLAHLGLLELAAALPGVTAVAALLTTKNVAKGVVGASLEHRVGMLLEARATVPGLVVLAANTARFVDQAEALRTSFPDAAFDFVVGFDTLVRLFDPVYYGDMPGELGPFFARHRLVAANRGDGTVREVERFLDRPDVEPFRPAITVLELDEARAAVSSTLARQAAANGAAGAPVLPAVARYIDRHALYRE